MKKYIIYTIVFLGLCLSYQHSQAQRLKYFSVDFNNIKARVWNDTIMLHKLQLTGTDQLGQTISGTITLSMCNCYCDSLWDAWPDCYPDCFMGNGGMEILDPTSGYSSTSSSGIPELPSGRRLRGRGTLYIEKMSNGQELSTPFALPVNYNLTVN